MVGDILHMGLLSLVRRDDSSYAIERVQILMRFSLLNLNSESLNMLFLCYD